MNHKIITTGDGSKTIFLPEVNEYYHSKHGAIQESIHVFINAGFNHFKEKNSLDKISILEVGFGTGLNAYLTMLEAERLNVKVDYVGIEAFPLGLDQIQSLDYPRALENNSKPSLFYELHESSWEAKHELTEEFTLTKQKQDIKGLEEIESFDLVYFDAFGPRVQPELWTLDIFKKMYRALKAKGVLVTYSAKGSVRRAMQDATFSVERLPGPPGKREMLRATVTI
ncbi:MAG: tRNA (5-methylaminomethyl-2-thiouridine)(34)-methyltransferase MnmD [Bacteroidia bacterium]|nr:tRNA (5-methylaminomethyl-2-thiouridine)(34)-methyltransferase MnmD [Bacteroidia bacterium]